MAAKSVTLRKVEVLEWAIGELLACDDLAPAQRAGLEQAAGLARSLRPSATPAAAHTPVAYDRGVVGCSCGYRPERPAARASTILSAYRSHLAKLGIPRTSAPVIMGYGPNAGKPW